MDHENVHAAKRSHLDPFKKRGGWAFRKGLLTLALIPAAFAASGIGISSFQVVPGKVNLGTRAFQKIGVIEMIVFERRLGPDPQYLMRIQADGTGSSAISNALHLAFRKDVAFAPRLPSLVIAGKKTSSEKYEIYSMASDGSSAKVLTSNGNNVQPAKSPSGRQIVYTHLESNPGGQAGLYLMNSDGTGVKRLSSTITARYPIWSPDGNFILYNDRGRIYRQPLVGGAVSMLAADAQTQTKFSLSPDGKKLAYGLVGGYVAVRDISVPNPSFGPPKILTIHGIGQSFYVDNNPSWSPDGTRIVFQRYYPKTSELGEYSGLIILDAVEGERKPVRKLTKTPLPGTFSGFEENPVWVSQSTSPMKFQPPN